MLTKRKEEQVVEFALAMCAVTLSLLIVYAPAIPFENFATPFHHDDFTALVGVPELNFASPRPISFALLHTLAKLGVGTYYVILTAIWIVCFSFTVLVVRQFYFEPTSYSQTAIASLFVSAFWFAVAPSAATTQLMGLITNASSYLFAIVAAFVALRPRFKFEIARWIIFCVLVFLAAFSKEDMAVFLTAILVWRLYCSFEQPQLYSKASTIFALAMVVLIYAASFVQAKLVGSPFLFGSGPYDVSRPFSNLAQNVIVYFRASPATVIIYIFDVLALIMVLAFRSFVTQFVYRRLLALTICVGALAFPYLLLPRYFDFYNINFFPFGFAAFVVSLSFLLRVNWRAQERTAILLTASICGLIFAVLWLADATQRNSILRWYEEVRSGSRRQLQELTRLNTLGLTECKRVRVRGVSAVLGPFLDSSSRYLDRFLGRELAWEIEIQPGTVHAEFAATHKFDERRWKYVLPGGNEQQAPDCELRFNPMTLYATLHMK